MEMAHKGVVSFDALVLTIDPFLQRDRDTTDAAAIADGIAMMEPQTMRMST